MQGHYNTRSPAVKRLMKEAQELSEPTDQYYAQPLEDNLFEWHFTIRGPADTEFENGIYHGRIILPVDYPMKPPSIIWLTPNGRFETNKKICLSISGHHPESWQPSWSIRTALLAIIGFMPTHSGGAIGALDYKPEERKQLAKKSKEWKCPSCGDVTEILLEPTEGESSATQEAKELAAQINLQGEKPKCKDGECPIEQAAIAAQSTSAKTEQTSSNLPTTSKESESAPQPQTPTTGGHADIETNRTVPNTPPPHPFSTWQPMSSIPYTNTPPFPPFPGFPPMCSWPPQQNLDRPDELPSTVVPRFPFPPSYYPNGYVFPSIPPAFGMPFMFSPFSCPFPPFSVQYCPAFPAQSRTAQTDTNLTASDGEGNVSNHGQISRNNSYKATAQDKNSKSNGEGSSNQSQGSFSRTLMTAPVYTSPNPALIQEQSNQDLAPSQENSRVDLFQELLSKVKRVGSDPKPAGSEEQPRAATPPFWNFGENDKNIKADHSDSEVTGSVAKKKSASGKTDTDTGHPRGDVVNDPATNEEENSEADLPSLDEEKKLNFSSMSMSEFEKFKQLEKDRKKSLRQRQSAMARISDSVAEDTPVMVANNSPSTSHPQIQADSGDSPPRVGPSHNTRGAALRNRQNIRQLLDDARNRNSIDIPLIAMIVFMFVVIALVMNRVYNALEWSDTFEPDVTEVMEGD